MGDDADGEQAPRSLTAPGTSVSTLKPTTVFSSHQPGSGHLHLANPSRARFSSLRASYPLKLLAPAPLASQPQNIAICYTLAYGGGLVAGDVVSLRVGVDEGCGLVMLTQGSTKVFKHRPGMRPRSHEIIREPKLLSRAKSSAIAAHSDGVEKDVLVTRQRLHVTLAPHSFLLLMPDSISPFRGSRYSQAQRFILPGDKTASAIILDWINSGRGQRSPAPTGPVRTFIDGEEEEVWAMESYASTNEVIIGDKMIMRERLVLEAKPSMSETPVSTGSGPTTPPSSASIDPPSTMRRNVNELTTRLAPYHVYATVLIIGPQTVPLQIYLQQLARGISQMQIHTPPELLWAYSQTDQSGGVLRLAGKEVEDVKVWLRGVMAQGGMKELVGDGLWPRII